MLDMRGLEKMLNTSRVLLDIKLEIQEYNGAYKNLRTKIII